MVETYQLKKFDSGMHYIMLDNETVRELTKNGNKRVIGTLNGIETLHAAIMPKKEGGYFINIGMKTCNKLKVKEGSMISASFTIDTSKYQFEMPEELVEVLNTDIEASQIFHSLTDGNQRGLMYLVGKLKTSEKKIECALKIANRIKSGITSPKQVLK